MLKLKKRMQQIQQTRLSLHERMDGNKELHQKLSAALVECERVISSLLGEYRLYFGLQKNTFTKPNLNNSREDWKESTSPSASNSSISSASGSASSHSSASYASSASLSSMSSSGGAAVRRVVQNPYGVLADE